MKTNFRKHDLRVAVEAVVAAGVEVARIEPEQTLAATGNLLSEGT